eukprot:scaffold4521_cov388-Prasinococcus_capsulatus_cf.AAC.15
MMIERLIVGRSMSHPRPSRVGWHVSRRINVPAFRINRSRAPRARAGAGPCAGPSFPGAG